MSRATKDSNETSVRRGRMRRLPIIAVVLVPLAFAGLFIGSLGEADESLDRIPAAVVNSDELVNQTAEDGTETPVFAGRQLVTELTAGDDTGFDWTITNADEAEAALAAGDVYAVLTVPSDFSASILSLQSDDPRQAELSIRTDDAHSFLSGTVAESVGAGMVSAFGQAITAQYISGIYSSVGDLGSSLGTAADGAGQLASGASELGSGLGALSTGAAAAQSGASSLASGITTYTGGVSSLSAGLGQLNAGAGRLGGISQGVGTYTSTVAQLSAAIASATAGLDSSDPAVVAASRAGLAQASAGLAAVAAQGGTLAAQTTGGIQGIQSGISQSASGAARLAAGSAPLTSGASSLAGGLGDLSTGAAGAATGASDLATGAGDLATGLQNGADQVPAMDEDAGAATAEVASQPVALTIDRDNEVPVIGQVVATFLVPLGLWVGALAIFLVAAAVSRPALASSARSSRILSSTLGRAGLVSLAQALPLVALLHLALGVSWSLLPVTLGFAVVMALGFTAFHHLLTIAFGRAGLVVSLLLLAVQVTSTGGLYPLQLIAAPFQAISPLLPLTYGVSGMQAILAGGNTGTAVVAALVLLGFGVLSVLVSLAVLRRVRRAHTLGLFALPA